MMFRAVTLRPPMLQSAPVVVVRAPRAIRSRVAAPPRAAAAAGVQSPGARKGAVPPPRKALLQPDAIAPDSFFVPATRIQTIPVDILGPVNITTVDGRRGVVSTRGLTTGELLWAVSPLAKVHAMEAYPAGFFDEPAEGEEDEDKEMDETLPFQLLVDRLMSKTYSARELAWLGSLRSNGTNQLAKAREGKESTEEPDMPAPEDLPPVDLAQLQKLDDTNKTLPLPASMTRELVQDIVQLNTFMAQSEDVPLSMCTESEEEPGILALFPQYAMMNHSCSPNSVSYMIGGKMVTRAARAGILKGAELTRMMLPQSSTLPLSQRREYMLGQYGVRCNCKRCTAEEALPQDFRDMIESTWQSTTEMREVLEEAVQEGSEEGINKCKDQLAGFVTMLDAALEKYNLPEETQIWVQACLFETYELLFTSLASLGQYEPRLTALLTGLVGAVNPGSEQHEYWAYMHLRQVQEIAQMQAAEEQQVQELTESVEAAAKKSDEFKAADQLCFKANCARYGRITPPVYRQILATLAELEAQQAANSEEEGEEGGEFAEDGEDGEEEGEEEGEHDDGNVVDVKSEDVMPKSAAR